MIHSTFTSVGARIKLYSRLLVVSLCAASLVLVPFAATAQADTSPPSGTPATVSADPLPTVQINGIVWKQAIVGNTVYAVGRFTEARPAGVAVGGAGSVTRNAILAYDITTGNLNTNFVHSITGGSADVRAVAASPDGKQLYVGGSFTTVDGQARSNFAAFDLTTNSLLAGFTNVSGSVRALAATNSQVFVGGAFSTAGGQARKMVAAYNSDGTINTSWKADVTGVTGSHVDALAVASAQGNLIIGGSFSAINAKTYYSIGAVKTATGAVVSPWASTSSSFPIRMQAPSGVSPSGLGITSLSSDGSQVYLTAFTYLPGMKHPGSFEGRAAINPTNGNIIWLNDCAGDSYDAYAIGQVLYSVSHAHNCSPIGGYPNQASWRALAETTYKTGTNGKGMGGNYPSFEGQPRGTLLNWFPTLNTGSVSGSSQAAWSVVGTSSYVALGGEFTKANGGAQQGLVRYGVKSVAPNKIGPMNYPTPNAIMTYPADSTGKSTVRIYVTGDPDNALLTYEVYRRGTSTPVATKTVDSRYWKATSWTFTDTGVPVGASLYYTLKVKDAFGNTLTMDSPTVVNDTDTRVTYSSGWTSSQSRADGYYDFARGIHYTKTSGASYTTTFYGSALTIYGEKAANRGTSTVYIDGVNVGTIDQYNATTVFQQAIFSRTGLGFGRHTLKVVKSSDGKYMDMDALAITASSMLDDRSSAFVFKAPTTDWTRRANSTYDDFGKSLSYTKKNGQSYTTTFTGTSFAVIGEKSTNRGRMTISVDGATPVTVTAYNATTKFSQLIYSQSGLAAGTHKVTVTKVDGTYMDVDAIEVR